MLMPPVITFLSDFGQVDTYVGQVKGAILGVLPGARIVDLTHSVPPQDVATGAFLLSSSIDAFPAGSIHLAVVDPGVGSSRRGVAARTARGDILVGPDNGLLGLAADRLGGSLEVVELRDSRYWRPDPATTFHGRDVFGPVAAHLAAGISLEQLGPPLESLQRSFYLQTTRHADGRVEGELVHVDGYGNIVTSIATRDLPAEFLVRIGSHAIPGFRQGHYQLVPPGELLALVGSAGLLEVSMRDGSAAARLGAIRGTPVIVIPRETEVDS